MVTNANEMLFRASSMGAIMSGCKKGWDVENSLTCKRKLVEMFRQEVWQRRYDKSNKYVKKGIEVENDSITLYCRVKKGEMFKKNTIRLNNEFFTGELDLYRGESITKATRIVDIKSSYDWTTFPSICDTEVDDNYEYQGLVYMDLTGAGLHTVAHCLVNTPAHLITTEKWRKRGEMGIIDTETEEFIEACIEIEKNHIFDMGLFLKEYPYFEFHCKDWNYDIPMIERVHELDVVRDDKKIARMKERIDECRIWMNKNLFKVAA